MMFSLLIYTFYDNSVLLDWFFIYSTNFLLPELAIVPKLLIRSSLDIPIPFYINKSIIWLRYPWWRFVFCLHLDWCWFAGSRPVWCLCRTPAWSAVFRARRWRCSKALWWRRLCRCTGSAPLCPVVFLFQPWTPFARRWTCALRSKSKSLWKLPPLKEAEYVLLAEKLSRFDTC